MIALQSSSNQDVSETLLKLAPPNLEIDRKERYDGGGFSVSLAQFAPENVSLIIQLYNAVKKTYVLWLYMRDVPNYELLKSHIISQIGTKQFLSAIDRVLYNFINNAARFTANDRVRLTIFQSGNSLVRWVVQNTITAEQSRWLNEVASGDLKELFLGGLTRGGHGIGLSNCVDFVAASFGVPSEEALEQGCLGAKIIEDHYYAWFHWPEYKQVSGQDDLVCDCGH